MLGAINSNLKPNEIKLYLAKPNMNRDIIASLKEAKIPSFNLKFSHISEINFEIPYDIQVKDEIIKNPNIDKIRPRFLIKAVEGDYEEWFVIRQIEDSMDDSDFKKVTIFSLGYELNDKTVREFKRESENLEDIGNALLSNSIWSIGHVDEYFLTKFRTFEHTGTDLNGIYELAKTFGALIEWDTVNRRINFWEEENIGEDKGLRISYGKYLKSLNKTEDADEMVTQLEVYGSEGLSLHTVNPTGSGYIEDFSYFLDDFDRDENRNVISHSAYMEDDLCHAIIDYNNKIEASRDTFSNLLTDLKSKQEMLTTIQNEYDTLEAELIRIQDIVVSQQALGTYTRQKYSRKANTIPETFPCNIVPNKSYVLMGIISSKTDLTFKFNDVVKDLNVGEWQVVEKFTGGEEYKIVVSGKGAVDWDFIGFQITPEEMETADNEADLIKKYNEVIKQGEVDAKKAEVDTAQAEVDAVMNSIRELQTSLSLETNFTPEQIIERNQFEITKEVTDDNIVDAEDLYEFGIKQFKKLRKPKTVLNMNIVNFLNVVECHKDWKKLKTGDIITVHYEKFGIDAKLRLLEVNRNGEDDTDIDIVISDILDINNADDIVKDILSNAMSTSTTLQMNKHKYDTITDTGNSVEELINNIWDAAARELKAGLNNSVEINRRGITITSPDDPLLVLRANNGILAVSDDGGLTFKHAITGSGIVGEQIIGKILIGQLLTLENDSGKFLFNNEGVTIENASFRLVSNSDSTDIDNGIRISPEEGFTATSSDDLVKTILNATEGIKIQVKDIASSEWTDVFYVDSNGKLTANDLVAKRLKIITGDENPITLIDAETKTIDFSAFTTILGTLAFDVMKGGQITLGGEGNGNGNLKILNEFGEISVDLDAERRGFDQLYVAKLESPSIVTYSAENLVFYVSDRILTEYTGSVAPDDENHGTSWYAPLASITEALRRIPASYDGNCQIWIAADSVLYEDIALRGYTGKGSITIDGQRQNSTKIVGNLSAGGNLINIRFRNFTINGRPSSYSVVSSFQNNYAVFEYINLYGNNSERGFDILQSGFGQIINCDVRNVTLGICARYGSTAWIEDTTGQASQYGVYAQGGFAVGTGKAPLGSSANSSASHGGQIHATYTYPTITPPSPPSPVETTKRFGSTTGNAWRDNFGGSWLNGNTVVQGYYGGYGVYRGLWIFGSSPSSTVTGKTIKSIRIKVTRLNNGGSSGAVNCYFRPHNYTSLPAGQPSYPSIQAYPASFRWGESKWVTLPSSFYAGFQNGTYKGIGIYVDSTSSSNYAKFSISATLEITYA
ncbi:hypothetical protein AF332_11170 [Sporosarcina globispora]|uniref:Uncharacterized protein n=1 Tax=Sporosarcina globispora TaxID=1459 RepID=A0A0M0GD31_SPOGL|nr:phage tail spike protein [Sporosarcina globispora]KON87331.1 hypothetical protein AF332_11170 [Sporosarcina globispora]